MARSRALKNMVAFGVACLLVAGGGSAAFADQLAIDGDGLTPVQSGAASVEACTDQSVEFTVLIAARRNGNPNANANNGVFANGSAVTVGFVSATAGMTATLADTSITLESEWQGSASNNTQNDLSDETLAAVVTLPAKSVGGSGSVTFSYSGVNNAGGPVSGTNAVAVTWTTAPCITDSTAPQLQLPGPITAEATNGAGALVTYSAAATDETAPAAPAVMCSPASGATFPLGTTTVACSATDTAGNTGTGSFTVTVQDTTAPVVGSMSNLGLEASGALTTVTWTDPTAVDAVSGAPVVSCTPASSTGFPVGETTVACRATDAAGNTGSSSFTVTISDTGAPVLMVPEGITAEATGPTGAVVEFLTSASDLVDGDVAVTCSRQSGDVFPLGATAVTCSASDSRGNTVDDSFVVTVVDTTAPAVTVPASSVVEATGPSGAPADYASTATDAVDGEFAATCVPAPGTSLPLGINTITCSATDAAGNTGSNSFTVTVVDTTPPAIEVPAAITAEATGPGGAAVSYSVTATDLVDGAVDVTCAPVSGSTFALGGHQVDCTAIDAAGNEGSASFAVTVVDTTAPAITVPGTLTAEATGPAGAPVTYTVTATDTVSGSVAAACTPSSGATFPLGTTSVVCTAIDAAGNEGSASFAVTVVDTTAPVITWIGGPSAGGSYVFGSVPAAGSCTAVDTVSGFVPCTVGGYGAAVGPHTLTASATDGSGNTATETRSYSVSAWTLRGFSQPVDMNGVWNSVKGGSTVPLKFEVFAGSTELVGTSAVASFTQKEVSCVSGSSATDEIEVTTTGGTTLRYDTTGGQFIQNWQTPKKPGTCYSVTMTTQDGSKLTALFKLK